MIADDPDLLALGAGSLLQGTLDRYGIVLAGVAVYAVFLLTSFAMKPPGIARKTLLASGVGALVYAWGFVTVTAMIVSARWDPHDLVRIGLEASFCLFAVLLLLIPRNLVARRIGMPTAFTLAIGASIAAVYSDLLFLLWAATPLR